MTSHDLLVLALIVLLILALLGAARLLPYT